MNTGKTVFSQVMEFLPFYEFRKCVERYHGDYKVKSFTCMDQFLCLAFAQLTFRESLRDIEACLRSMQSKLYHMGIRGRVSRNTLSNANNQRDWHIYADFAQILIHRARPLYADDSFGVALDDTIYALDSTTIDLCLTLFPWARYQRDHGAIKIHTLLDLRGPIPAFIDITDGKIADVDILDSLIPEAGSFYIMDRGYHDFTRLYALHQAKATFIIRDKANTLHQRVYSRPVDKNTGLRCDQTIALSPYGTERYPELLRLVRFFDSKSNKRFMFLTNNFTIEALTVAELYKARWKVELFFKWIKQHLRIKAFFGTSENAVKTQIWVAVSVYILIAIVKKRLNLKLDLYTILQILSVSIFEKTPIAQVLMAIDTVDKNDQIDNQLLLFKL
ncbi:MAG: IS4 family transposase [Candidatus Omnitrophota bacterium]